MISSKQRTLFSAFEYLWNFDAHFVEKADQFGIEEPLKLYLCMDIRLFSYKGRYSL